MTDDRAGDPVGGSRPAATGSDAARSSALAGPASAPFRIPVATPVADRRPTMVRLTRRSGPRLGLRPPGAALVTAPTATAAGRSSPGTPSSGIPSPAAAAAPSTRAPVDAVTLPAGRVPAGRGPGTGAGPGTPEPPTDAVPEPPAARPPAAAPIVAPTTRAGGADVVRPAEAPAAPKVLPLAVTSAPAAATPSPDAAPPVPVEERRRPAAEARVGEADYAATSAMLASAGARLAAWRRGWTGPRVLRLVTATCAVLVVVVCGLGWGAASWVEAAVRQIGALDPNSPAIQNAAAQAGDQNFLVVGSDSRAGAPPSEDAGDTADVPGARTDTIMIVHVPEDRSGVTVVSFPRDLEITRPACERWDPVTGAYAPQMLPPAPRVKLNSAYAAGGPRCVTRAVQELSGLAINRFLGVDFQGFQGMVDSVRGVPICVERPVKDSVLGPIIDRPGPTVLTGQQALDYVRARHVEGDPSSDYGRIQRQQRFLGALLRSVLSAGTLLDPGRLNGLVEAVSRSTFGENIGSDQLLTLTQSLGSLDPRSVAFVTVPTTGIANDRGNEVLRPAEERAMFDAIIEGRPLPGAPGAPAAPAPAPVDVRLVDGRSPADSGSDDGGDPDEESEDGGSSSGPSAASIAERLRGAGFGVVADDSGSSSNGRGTSIRYSPDQAVAAQALAAAVPGATLEPTASGNGTLTLTLGDDFDGRVRSSSAGMGGAPSAPVNPTITAADATCA
ncbi:LCP family protein [Actinomycetospora rhizophila]|uniref:LCP family protein n=1 Tax=Actinomycetospora rhizophila TaxID=1416876 RepID=A0ABV9Z8B9_9PSEU